MLWNKQTFLLATLALLMPTVAVANDIDVRAGDVRVNTYEDGSIYVESGQTKVEVPAYSSTEERWHPFGWVRLPWGLRCRSSNNSIYQRTTQTTESYNGVVRSRSFSSQSCE
jgi:hypothetical protein